MDFIFGKLQASIFTPDFSVGNRPKLIKLFQEISDNKFDGDIFSGPIPQEAPAEIPRISLKSNDGFWQLQVSLRRTDLLFIKPANITGGPTTPSLKEFSVYANRLFSDYNEKRPDIRIQRLALITERYAKASDVTPAQFLSQKFCKKEFMEDKAPFNNVKGFEIHSLKRYDKKGFTVNSWVRLRGTDLLDFSINPNSPQKTPIILLSNDVNTLSDFDDPDKDFDKEDVNNFFSFFPDHIKSIVDLYFN